MSVEVNTMEYQFQPSGDQHGLSRDVQTVTDAMENIESLPGDDDWDDNDTPSAGGAVQKWFYSPIHDLESAFWLFVYFVLYRDIHLLPVKSSLETDDQSKSIVPTAAAEPLPEIPPDLKESDQERGDRITAQYLFCQGLFIDRDRRLATLNVNQRLNDHLANYPLHPALRKTVRLMTDDSNASKKTQLSRLLIEARDIMKKYYSEIESDVQSLPAKRHTIADGLHWKLQAVFFDAFRCIQAVKNWHVCIRPLSTEYWTFARRLPGADKQHTSVASSQGGAKRKHDVLATIAEEEDEVSAEVAQEPPKKRVTRTTRAAASTRKRKRTAAAEDDAEFEAVVKAPPKTRRKRGEGPVKDGSGDAGPEVAVAPGAKRPVARAPRTRAAPPAATRAPRTRAQGVDRLGRTRASTRRAQT